MVQKNFSRPTKPVRSNCGAVSEKGGRGSESESEEEEGDIAQEGEGGWVGGVAVLWWREFKENRRRNIEKSNNHSREANRQTFSDR
jgi:hypothetical protein